MKTENFINEFEKLSDEDKLYVIEKLNNKTYNIMTVKYYGPNDTDENDIDEMSIHYFNKDYHGRLDKEYGWNFWECESNDLADEDTSFNGDIYNIDELKDYFEDNIYIR